MSTTTPTISVPSSDFTIDSVYPWGRSLAEYVKMFALSDEDLKLRIVGCADGPASFNGELTQQGGSVVSCDPLYQFTAEQIRGRIEKTADVQVDHVRKNAGRFVFNVIRSPEEMRQRRLDSMEKFLADFPTGLAEGRYLNQSLPNIQFPDGSFDLALCSHFLFLYSHVLSFEFHLQSILEMCRIAREVRIFPLLNMEAQPSVHLEPVLNALREHRLEAMIQKVPYEFLRGANQMLVIRNAGELR